MENERKPAGYDGECPVCGSRDGTIIQGADDRFKNFTAGLKPIRQDADREDYFTRRYLCPICKAYLTSHSYGRSWTANGLYSDQLIDCPNCGQAIDWSGEPRVKED